MILRLFLVFLLVFIANVANAFANPIPVRDSIALLQNDNGGRPLYGVSYSFEQAAWYGLDPRESYIELLDQFKFDWVRLPFLWDQMIADPSASSGGELRIEDLKFAIEEADKRNVKVIVALGAKTPYFPEYHWPGEIEKQVEFGATITPDHPIADEILETSRQVVETLAPYDNIISWQVENEPLIGNVNRWKIDTSLIEAEVEVVRSADSKHRPIILNHAATGFYDKSWQTLLLILKPGDIFAVNAFFKTKGTDLFNAKILGYEIHVLWPDHFVWPVYSWGFLSPDIESIKEKVEAHGNTLWILEMQAEPYIKKLEEADDSLLPFEPGDIELADNFMRSHQIESVGLWGAHFWQYRQSLGDDSWVDAVKQIID